jgi:hypothetical protein
VARLMHRLFSAFDAAITSAGLFKMDTVGDAYVAAGFLPRPLPKHLARSAGGVGRVGNDGAVATDTTEEEPAAATGQACDRVLRAARDMIAAVAACREETGRDVHCRIGVSAGEVLAGVLGHLQPRFHIFGAGLSAAERHEKAGQIDAVHASPAFMVALALEAHPGEYGGGGGGGTGLQTPAAAAAALERGSAGSSGRWNVRQSEVMDLLPAAAGVAAVSDERVASAPTSPAIGASFAARDPAKGRALFRSVANSFILSFKSASMLLPAGSAGDNSCDVAEPPCGFPPGGLQRSFILMPQSGPGDGCQTADPGSRFYHATASVSRSSLDDPLPESLGRHLPASHCRTSWSRSFGAGLPGLRSQLLLMRGGSLSSADVCFDPPPVSPGPQASDSPGTPGPLAGGAVLVSGAGARSGWDGGGARGESPVAGLALEARLFGDA